MSIDMYSSYVRNIVYDGNAKRELKNILDYVNSYINQYKNSKAGYKIIQECKEQLDYKVAMGQISEKNELFVLDFIDYDCNSTRASLGKTQEDIEKFIYILERIPILINIKDIDILYALGKISDNVFNSLMHAMGIYTGKLDKEARINRIKAEIKEYKCDKSRVTEYKKETITQVAEDKYKVPNTLNREQLIKILGSDSRLYIGVVSLRSYTHFDENVSTVHIRLDKLLAGDLDIDGHHAKCARRDILRGSPFKVGMGYGLDQPCRPRLEFVEDKELTKYIKKLLNKAKECACF